MVLLHYCSEMCVEFHYMDSRRLLEHEDWSDWVSYVY